jgi:nucleotide-binding universal stress UspA family protein
MTAEGLFPRILVPTDFSAGSKKAWSLAQRVAATLGAELVLLHVLPATPLDTLEREERRAELHRLQAEHQLGIPRADDEEEPAPRGPVFEGPLTGEALERFSAAGREWAALLEQWASAGRAGGCKVRTMLRVGVPYREVVAAAKDERADLVLLATHGHGQIHRLLVGSVADRVIRMAPCPVLTVKEA